MSNDKKKREETRCANKHEDKQSVKSEPVESEALEVMCKYIRTTKHPGDEFKYVLSLARMIVMPRGLVPKIEALSNCRYRL